MSNNLNIRELPSYVVAQETGVGRGLGIFDISHMGQDVCAVIGAYLHYHDGGETTPCFIVQTPEGRHVNIAITKVRYVGPAERGELFRSGIGVHGITEYGQ